jgi:hypothetical protein
MHSEITLHLENKGELDQFLRHYLSLAFLASPKRLPQMSLHTHMAASLILSMESIITNCASLV